MEIGQEIKQNKFKSEHHKMAINIIFTGGWLENLHACNIKPYGISTQQFNILRILRGQYPNPVTVNLLIDRMLDKNSNASRLVEKLRIKKLVEREINKEDRRAVEVVITNKGLALLKELDVHEKKFLNVLECLSIADAKKINSLLDKLRS